MTSIEQPNAEVAETPQKPQKDVGTARSHSVIACAVEVQRQLGTGLLESAYAGAMAIELETRGLQFHREQPLAATYKGRSIGVGYRADLVVENRLLLELKALETILEVHRAQVLS